MKRIFIARHYILAAGWLARGLPFEKDMTSRLTAVTLTLSLATGGCFSSTAHQLVLTDNPLREQAIACEQLCRGLRAPAHNVCERTPGQEGCTVPVGSQDDYASCLDTCPGSRSKDGASCPDPPVPGLICVETSHANAGGIAGTVVAVIGIGLAVLAFAALLSFAGAIGMIGGG
jgi:hypothetical protein